MGSTLFLVNGKETLISHGEFVKCYKCDNKFNILKFLHVYCEDRIMAIEEILCKDCGGNHTIPRQQPRPNGNAWNRNRNKTPSSSNRRRTVPFDLSLYGFFK